LEQTWLTLVADVRKSITIPLAVKLSPYITALSNFATRLVEAGADALVLFNRFYQPDIDIEELQVVPNLELSTSSDLRLPLRWVAILHGRLKADLALTSGIHTANDVIKAVMAGASVTMMTSELLHSGTGRVSTLLVEVEKWLVEHEYVSVAQMRGSLSHKNVSAPAAYERANYIHALRSYKNLP
jgi:dihydroorotate dehydrogenase (fumarate)